MISTYKYEEWYRWFRFENAELSTNELERRLVLVIDVCKRATKRTSKSGLNKRALDKQRHRWDPDRMAVRWQALRDELSERFSRDVVHHSVGYDS
jgi:hypothetical protein